MATNSKKINQKTTGGVKVTVKTHYLGITKERMHRWDYTVNVENKTDDTVKLIERCWYIPDGYGSVREDHSKAEKSVHPDEYMKYVNHIELGVPQSMFFGYMRVHKKGRRVKLPIPTVSLDSPISKVLEQ